MLSQTPPARIAYVLLALLLFGYVVNGLLPPLAKPYIYSDFSTFYSASEAFSSGKNPYDLETLHATGQRDFSGWIGRYFYPPPFAAAVVRPLTWLHFPSPVDSGFYWRLPRICWPYAY